MSCSLGDKCPVAKSLAATMCTYVAMAPLEYILLNSRMSFMNEIADRRPAGSAFTPLKVKGPGRIYELDIWLNVRDVANQGLGKGQMTIAINSWLDYFSVR